MRFPLVTASYAGLTLPPPPFPPPQGRRVSVSPPLAGATVLRVKFFFRVSGSFRAFHAQGAIHMVRLRTMLLRIVSNLRMQAVIATFGLFPASMRRV